MKDFILPDEKLDVLSEHNLNSAFVCNSILFGKEIGGLMVVCNQQILDKLGFVGEELSYLPLYKAKMYNIKRSEISSHLVFEMEFIFENGVALKIHFNPEQKAFKDFCKRCIKTRMMSLHFLKIENHNTSSVHFNLEGIDEIDWFKINLDLVKGKRTNFIKSSLFYLFSSQIMEMNEIKNSIYFQEDKEIKFIGF